VPPAAERASPTARVAERLRKAILAGAYAAGATLREGALARRYRVSRGVMRDALRRVAADGLIEVRAPGEAVVADVSPAGLMELRDMLTLLEPLALRLAIPKLGPDDLARADAALDAAEREPDAARAAAHRWTFRAALYAPSGRPLLVDNVRRLRAQAAQYEAALGAGAVRSTRDERALVASLRAGRGDEAVERLRRSIERPAAALAAMLGRRASPPSGPRPTRGPRRRT